MKSTPGTKILLRSRLIPGLVVLLMIVQLIDPYRGWMVVLGVFGGAWLIAFLWSRSLSGGLFFKREMRFGWAQVGDRLEERFTLQNQGELPAIWVEVQDHSTLPDYQARGAQRRRPDDYSLAYKDNLYPTGIVRAWTDDTAGHGSIRSLPY